MFNLILKKASLAALSRDVRCFIDSEQKKGRSIQVWLFKLGRSGVRKVSG